jgi:stage II sporulation protein D
MCTRKSNGALEENSNSDNELDLQNSNASSDDDGSATTYDYASYKTIKLYHSSTEEIEELPFDEYLYGTVSAEMPATYETEALKAQAIVSRTYTLYQIINSNGKHGDADICDSSTCCQAWISKDDRLAKWNEDVRESNWNKIVQAVDETSGKIITYNGNPIDAFFHSNSGGTTETVSNVWGGTDLPYLQSVETAGESDYSQYNSEVSISKNDLIDKLKAEYSDFEINFDEEDAIKILEYTDSGRVKTIKIGNTEIAGTKARSLLGLKSTNFSFSIDGDNVIFSVVGYGHGVGMSQTGADSMAKTGSSCEEIIKHFYTGVEITFVNEL